MNDEVCLTNGEDILPRTVPEPHAISHRRKIGAFYTPLEVATMLCDWGVRTNSDIVLEPCFGGCTFLEALLTRLQNLGQITPENQLFGCDIDPLAFEYLENFGDVSRQRANFVLKDFLSVNEFEINQKFDLIIGNPPYIRHSKFDLLQKNTVAAWAEKYKIKLNGRASLWAYFIVHALHFLKDGGRVAWVLPVSFLTSAYSIQVREIISKHFAKISAITLTERLFITEGTEEATVILLADGFSGQHEGTQISIDCVDTIEEMKNLVRKWPEDIPSSPKVARQGNGMIPIASILIFESFASKNITLLKDIATIHIGLVTGDVPYFIKSKKMWNALGISSKYLKYIFPKSKWFHGISLNNVDELAHIEGDIPCLALNCPSMPKAINVKEYLTGYDERKIASNATFGKRKVWHYFFDDRIPDAFLVFMTNLGPRMVVNSANANCTNSVYRVFFNGASNRTNQKLIAISLNTTYSQFSAELLGQGRGSGALKLEPSHAQLLRLYMPKEKTPTEVDAAFNKLDILLRAGLFEESRKFSDEFIFGAHKEFNRILRVLEDGLEIGRGRRMLVQSNQHR